MSYSKITDQDDLIKDELIIEGFEAISEQEEKEFDSIDDSAAEFSQEFNERMEKLIKDGTRTQEKKASISCRLSRCILKRAWALAAVITVLVIMFSVVVYAMDYSSSSNFYPVVSNNADGITVDFKRRIYVFDPGITIGDYMAPDAPEYNHTVSARSAVRHAVCYFDENDDLAFIYAQVHVKKSASWKYAVFAESIEETTVNGMPAVVLMYPGGSNIVIWTDGSYCFSIKSRISIEKTLELAEKVKPVGDNL